VYVFGLSTTLTNWTQRWNSHPLREGLQSSASMTSASSGLNWSAAQDLNLYAFRHSVLSGTCLPIPASSRLVGLRGVEPLRPFGHLSLSQTCLPVPTTDRNWGAYRDLHSNFDLRRVASYLLYDRLKLEGMHGCAPWFSGS
jgi:hypothetical protein